MLLGVLFHVVVARGEERLVAVDEVLRAERRARLDLRLQRVGEEVATLVHAFELGRRLELARARRPLEERLALVVRGELHEDLRLHDAGLLLDERLDGIFAQALGEPLGIPLGGGNLSGGERALDQRKLLPDRRGDAVERHARQRGLAGEGVLQHLRAALDVLFQSLAREGVHVRERLFPGDVEHDEFLGGGSVPRCVKTEHLLQHGFALRGVRDSACIHGAHRSHHDGEDVHHLLPEIGADVLLGQNHRIGSVSGDGLLQVRVDGGLEPVRDAFEVASAKIEYAALFNIDGNGLQYVVHQFGAMLVEVGVGECDKVVLEAGGGLLGDFPQHLDRERGLGVHNVLAVVERHLVGGSGRIRLDLVLGLFDARGDPFLSVQRLPLCLRELAELARVELVHLGGVDADLLHVAVEQHGRMELRLDVAHALERERRLGIRLALERGEPHADGGAVRRLREEVLDVVEVCDRRLRLDDHVFGDEMRVDVLVRDRRFAILEKRRDEIRQQSRVVCEGPGRNVVGGRA